MRAVIQRVSSCSVTIGGELHSQIGQGLMILLGICEEDNDQDIDWLCHKVVNLRIFDDADGVMNLSVTDIGGEIMVVSQFTLYASTRKGHRPSYIKAAKPDISIPIYEKFLAKLELILAKQVKRGIFGSEMKVALTNEGPVTIIIDTKNRE